MNEVDDSFEIAVTGKSWMGKGTGSISTMIGDSLEKASDEIQIASYAITENSIDLLDLLTALLAREIRIMLVVNRLDKQPPKVRKKLLEMNKTFDNFILKDFVPASTSEDLHAKLIVIDRSLALVGSANLTWKGMVLNHEIMVRISGEGAGQIAKLVDRLARSSDARTVSKLGGG